MFTERILGQVFAFLIGMAGVGFGSYVAIKGEPVAGGIIATSALAGLAGVFLSAKIRK